MTRPLVYQVSLSCLPIHEINLDLSTLTEYHMSTTLAGHSYVMSVTINKPRVLTSDPALTLARKDGGQNHFAIYFPDGQMQIIRQLSDCQIRIQFVKYKALKCLEISRMRRNKSRELQGSRTFIELCVMPIHAAHPSNPSKEMTFVALFKCPVSSLAYPVSDAGDNMSFLEKNNSNKKMLLK